MAKETPKQMWQRYAKSQKIKFQDNDTIDMLKTSLAYKLGIDPTKVKGAKLKKEVEEMIGLKPVGSEKVSTKKPASKKDTTKKDSVEGASSKKDVTIEPPKDLTNKNEVKLPNFKDIPEMKNFCVSNGLNRIDGYILVTKGKKSDFLNWIKENIDKASDKPVNTSLSDSPHSPSAGIGEMEVSNNIEEAKKSVSPTPTISAETVGGRIKAPLQVTPKLDVPPLSTGEVINEMPTAISENNKMFNPEVDEVESAKEITDKSNKAMEAYGISIIHHLSSAPMFNINGGISRGELNQVLASSSKDFNYEVITKDGEHYLKISDHNENECRIPKSGSLPLI